MTPANIDDWVRRLGEEEMPVFAQTARHAAGISAREETSTAELARVVLMDSSMTARLLRLANSVFYNPSAKRITTVSRAIVMLGFETVRAIALSIAMIDTLLRGQRHERVVAEMACAFHAAVQARSLASRRGEPAIEEVFIATLLLRLGAMAFWCFPHGREHAMEEALAHHDSPEQAERDVLGFSFAHLTAAINREWRLSDLLAQSLDGRHEKLARIESIDLGNRIATNAAHYGWDDARTRKWIARAAALEMVPEAEITRRVYDNVREAIRAAVDYGAEAAAQRIPLPPLTGDGEARPEARSEVLGDADFRLRILRELSAMLSERVNVGSLLSMVMEGIYRGVVVDRVVLALLAPDSGRLKARYALGQGSERLSDGFNFAADDANNIFAQLLVEQEPIWLTRRSPRWRPAMTPEVVRCLGEPEFFAYPLIVGGRPRGLVYADRQPSGKALDERSFDAFRHFCEQAVIGLSIVGLRGD